ncbi:MAG: 50S ribosomal protein L25 [Patescibacteria group bacterium]|jgi:large subunit ribosomal protein L25
MTTEEIKLTAKKRVLPSRSLNQTRSRGFVPAELYGAGQENQHLLLNKLELERVYHKAGSSSLVTLAVEEDQPVQVMFHGMQFDPITGIISHVDFYRINMTEAIHVALPLLFIGEPKAVKELGGTLITPMEEVEISCLPKDLIQHLEVDLSALATFEDVIKVKNLNIPSTIKITNDPEAVVASVSLQKVEAEPVAPVATPVEGEAVTATPAAEGEAGKEAEKKERK